MNKDNFTVHDRADGTRIYKPRRAPWTPTSMDIPTDADTTFLREVYVNGVRFVRAPEYIESCEVTD